MNIAYATGFMKSGKMEKQVLLAAGVRSNGIDDLVNRINDWLQETTTQTSSSSSTAQQQDKEEEQQPMVFDTNAIFNPEKAWEHFLYQRIKKTNCASWESSYNRFANNEHSQTIPMSPTNGRPIQVNTVLGHIFTGMLSSRPIPFIQQLAAIRRPPNKTEWDTLC